MRRAAAEWAVTKVYIIRLSYKHIRGCAPIALANASLPKFAATPFAKVFIATLKLGVDPNCGR